jgi:hypothetical protein
MYDLKGLVAVCLGFHVLLYNIDPAPTTNVCSCAPVSYAQEIRFALDETHWKTMHGKNIQGFEGHCVVAAKHILITQEIRKIGRQSIPYPCIGASRNGSTTEFKPKQLPGVKHLPVALISPSMEAVSFIASWYLVVGNKERLHCTQDCLSFGVP